jgi:RNA polymerase sigma-70 factor (ECF subfamily)
MTGGTDTDDDALIGAIASGDLGALERLYRRLRVPVFAVSLAVVRDRAAAEDVLQETFVRVLEKAGTFRAGTRPRAWVLAIARNLAIDAVRRRREAAPYETRGAGDPLGRLVVTRALLELEPLEREIVALHALGGLTHAEIAEQLAMPPGTVRWKYRAALRRLEPLFAEAADA